MEQELIWQTRDEFPTPTNALQKLDEIFAFTSRDCSEDKMIACLYGIVSGWDDDSYKELKAKHNWSDDDVEHQKMWHQNFCKAWNLFMTVSENRDTIFNKLNITSEVLDKLGFSEYWDEHCTWGGRTLSFSNGTNFRIVEQNEMEDGNEGYSNPPYYVSNHFYYAGFFATPQNDSLNTDLFFLHEMYDCIKENYPDCLQEFYDKCESVYMAGYIDDYLKSKING